MAKEIKGLGQYIPKVEGKLRNENFVKNAPRELVAEEQGKLREAQAKLENLKAALAAL